MENIAPRGKLQPIQATNIPWQDLLIDFLINFPENRGTTSILVVMDQYLKMVYLIPLLSSTEATDVAAACFDSVVYLHGLPSTIILD